MHVIKYILEQEVDIDIDTKTEGLLKNAIYFGRTKGAQTALHYASGNGQLAAVEVLLQHNATIDIKDDCGNIPLNLASQYRHKRTALFLLKKMVFEIDLTPDTNFVEFIGFENEDKLLEAMKIGTAIIHFAIAASNIELVYQLIDQKGVEWALNSIDSQNRSLLHLASANGHLDIMESLIKHGSDIEAKDKYEKTPLHLASEYGQHKVAKILREHHAQLS